MLAPLAILPHSLHEVIIGGLNLLRKVVAGVGLLAVIGIASVSIAQWKHSASPPVIDENGVSHSSCLIAEWLCRSQTIDYASVIREATAQKSSFLTMTVERDMIREQAIEVRVLGVPSRGRVRVNYHVQYPIGYVLGDKLQLRGDGDKLVVVLDKPELIADVAVKLKGYQTIDSGFLVDEKEALLKLQQAIQPESQAQGPAILNRPGIIPTSEKALLSFLKPLVAKAASGQAPPDIRIEYR
jgi:hypothetical protein